MSNTNIIEKLVCLPFFYENKNDSNCNVTIVRGFVDNIISFLQSDLLKACHSNKMYSQFLDTVFTIIIRPIHEDPSSMAQLDVDEDLPLLDQDWQLFDPVYRMFLIFLQNSNVNTTLLSTLISSKQIYELIESMRTPDPRERDYLQKIIHSMLINLTLLKPVILRHIYNVFYRCIYFSEPFIGLNELIEIVTCLLSDLKYPINQEFYYFFKQGILPLHRIARLDFIHDSLVKCLLDFIELDDVFSDDIIECLLKYWPNAGSSDEILFLSELYEIFVIVSPDRMIHWMDPIVHKLSIALKSLHFQIAEKALIFWNNEHFIQLFTENNTKFLQIIGPIIIKNINNHWSMSTNVHFYIVLKILNKINPVLIRSYLMKKVS